MKLRELSSRLADVGVSEPMAEATMVFSELGGFTRGAMAMSDCHIPEELAETVILRRRNHEPIQYIIGHCYFFREKYTVNESTLIPRSDTEILVEYAVKNIPQGEDILDLCCGSGCIGISTLKNSAARFATLVDISEAALEVAERNAEQNGVRDRVEILKLDVMRDIPNGEYYAILSNPPYVSESEYSCLAPEIYREPKNAFLGGYDGLDFYSSLIPRLGLYLKRGGFIAFEIGYTQGDALAALAEKYGYNIEILQDYSQNPRVAVLRKYFPLVNEK